MCRSVLILVAFLVAGCAGTHGSEEAQQAQTQQAAAAQPDDDAKCRSEGFKPGSSDYVQCRRQLDALHLHEDSAETRERQGTSRALLGKPPAWANF